MLFSKLDRDKRFELLNYIKEFSKKNETTIISTSNNVDDLVFSDRIIFIKNKRIAFDGTYEELINNEELNIKLPWEIEVSEKLMMYELLDRKIDNIDEIIGELCK